MTTTPVYPKVEQMALPTKEMDITISKEKIELDVNNQEKEIKEVIEVIDETLVHLNNAIKRISNASDWGVYDTVCGGGCLSSMAKQDNMQDANREMRLANKCVEKLKKELNDVENIETVNISEFLSSMDIFFDNIFTDMMVQKKIADAERNCKKARRQLINLKNNLQERLNPKTISDMKAEEKIKKDQDEDIKAAFESSNRAIECLQANIRPLQKAIDFVGDDSLIFCCGCLGYEISETRLNEAKMKLRSSLRALDDFTKKLKKVTIDTTNRSEYLKFIEISRDIIECNSTSFDSKAKYTFSNAKRSCIASISEIESIRNELKDILVKKNIEF